MIGPGTAPVRVEVLGPGVERSGAGRRGHAAATPPAAPSRAAARAARPTPAARRAAHPVAAASGASRRRHGRRAGGRALRGAGRRVRRLRARPPDAAQLSRARAHAPSWRWSRKRGMRYYRLRLGPFARRTQAVRTVERINALGYPGADRRRSTPRGSDRRAPRRVPPSKRSSRSPSTLPLAIALRYPTLWFFVPFAIITVTRPALRALRADAAQPRRSLRFHLATFAVIFGGYALLHYGFARLVLGPPLRAGRSARASTSPSSPADRRRPVGGVLLSRLSADASEPVLRPARATSSARASAGG